MDGSSTQDNDYIKWYQENKARYETCGESITRLLRTILEQKRIPFQSITYRVKEEKSFFRKCQSGKYTDPVAQITDVCGIRIIGFTNQDVARICAVVEKEFTIDTQNSGNKGSILDTDRVGYLSVHYIATLKKTRYRLNEYKPYRDIRFEIQVRTILQHAWAEIEHDRSYKFSGELPREIKRRFYLIAGTLELMDREFERLSNEIDAYAQDVKSSTARGELTVYIDSTSIFEYMDVKFKDYPKIARSFGSGDKKVIEEVRLFGIKTLKDLDDIITDKIMSSPLLQMDTNFCGVLRVVMMVNNPKKYFEQAWQHGFKTIPKVDYDYILSLNPSVAGYAGDLIIRDGSRIPSST